MAFPLLGLLGGALLGGAKGAFIDAPRARKQAKAQAELTRWSPWTGMRGQTVQSPDVFGSAVQGAALGSMFQTEGANLLGGGDGPSNFSQAVQKSNMDPTSKLINKALQAPGGVQSSSPWLKLPVIGRGVSAGPGFMPS